MKKLTEQTVLKWLEKVKDPEIPVLSLIDLGVIQSVTIDHNSRVKVELTPTFAVLPWTIW